MSVPLPEGRWHIAPSDSTQYQPLIQTTGLSSLLAQVLLNRGITTPAAAQVFINPESTTLPSPREEFPDLDKAVELILEAIEEGDAIAICGDYDADGMTSTALLIRALRHFGAIVDYAIPSRMKDGYGINERMVTELAEMGVGLIITVDNGIAAHQPITLAVELGLSVILTDHHNIPPQGPPPADAILNPKLIPDTSPYHSLAGVGVAYVLAVTVGQKLGQLSGLTHSLLDLFTLGTIADLAPLVGVNRRWLKRGLKNLSQSDIAGVKALMQLAGVNDSKKPVKPDAIGFRLGPRINAIGRLSDPPVVIELLTTDDEGIALEKAMVCEQTNQKRQDLCKQIEEEALQQIEAGKVNWQEDRVLVIYQSSWHHGVIGIVASRLKDRYGAPVFICTDEEGEENIRGSARGIPEFNVADALNYADEVLIKHGGHKAAGGFSLAKENLDDFRLKLSEFAHQCVAPEHLKPLIAIDAQADFSQLNFNLYDQIESLQPWGIENDPPIFWTPDVRILEQQPTKGNHLKVKLGQTIGEDVLAIGAIAWRWGEYFPLPNKVDIAYKLIENQWNGESKLELELVGIRPATNSDTDVQDVKEIETTSETPNNNLDQQNNSNSIPSSPPQPKPKKAQFYHNNRVYTCSLQNSLNELRIRNDQNKVLAVTRGQRRGLLGESRDTAQEVDVTQPKFYTLIKAALSALGIN
ncbi:single-stranded-DNA-specific exonuclease RecJ [Spirulina sp. CS-785/01]|uniref:single-stranded-DNA-specific exonuclease RecJ n=1 Tax=Spirulina sp. CS-785/01 TaxID=3021716 RepID=UPI00232CE8ED|nr:single-stranded-DNA-specific exonuclease RecJ [Spirulina sp. CS-785/01]MDB9314550.1 single-stranded-DNA-specific exonuclease RecJ [Spirulina sp. CS-785/01]